MVSVPTLAFNFATMTQYSGHNATLANGGYATFCQIKSLGLHIIAGAKARKITSFAKKENEDGTKTTLAPRTISVFLLEDTNATPEKVEEIYSGKIKKSQYQINQEINAELAKALWGSYTHK